MNTTDILTISFSPDGCRTSALCLSNVFESCVITIYQDDLNMTLRTVTVNSTTNLSGLKINTRYSYRAMFSDINLVFIGNFTTGSGML